MAIKIIQLLHLISYLLVLGDALKMISLPNFLEQRKAIDSLMVKRFKMVYYTCLGLSIVMVVLSAGRPASSLFISSVIALGHNIGIR